MSGRLLLLALGVLLVTTPALAREGARHSGPMVSENMKQDTVTIAEMGPWHGTKTHPVRREFRLAPSTKVELAVRSSESRGFEGAFAERPMKATDLRVGDYVTVTVQHEGGKLVATEVEIVRPSSMTFLPAQSHPMKAVSRLGD
jgi:hypothetical protein